MRNLHLYVPNKDTYQSVVLKDEEIFQHHRKKNIICEGINTEAMALENEDFSDENQCQCINSR